MTCESCCREFRLKRHAKDCPYCGYNNGPGWMPRSGDLTGLSKTSPEAVRARKENEQQADADDQAADD